MNYNCFYFSLQKVAKRINNYLDELTYEVDYLSQ